MKLNQKEDELDERDHQLLALYYQGNSLEEIGKHYGITRERVRQIIDKQLRKDVEEKLLSYGFSNDRLEETDLAAFIRLEKKTILEIRERKQVAEKLEKVNSGGVDPRKFYSVRKYAEAMGVGEIVVEKYFPEIAELIKTNKEMKEKRWSRDYLKCRQCGTTSVKHHSLGLCRKCYIKSEYFKDLQRRSRIKNIDKRRAYVREYSKRYSERPGTLEKRRWQEDLKLFSGNREKAIQIAHYKCVFCDISRQESYEKYGKDLYVRHLNDKEDNRLESLIVLCHDCFHKKVWIEKEKSSSPVRQLLIKPIPKGRKSMSAVINIVANYYGVKPDDIIGQRRKHKFVVPRMVAAFLMRDQLGISFPKIGRKLGKRDHTTAIHSYEKISKEYNEKEETKNDIENIKKVL